ncbi:vanadium-dependent haloperoxidase [Actinoplanes auranticolor]|uniref:Phosphatidic acid phosphatase type 2/haloperoxidase domain-containing protein n=1 Tax=Actinoplanes auranticolor TaxID=47988 RepID=A0A919SSW0_9ACTN|nr:vanadium-dependent haloperoxidase [Actinoplanes auranticolor]GIM76956.1 hypothetical protein Aau02nite_73500 [Actinoplanes auranticolor]
MTIALTTGGLSIGGSPAAAAATDDRIDFWNETLLDAFRDAADFGAPTALSRAAAMMHLAIYDTSVSLGESTTAPYIARVPRQPGVSYDFNANVDVAAYTVLKALFPDPEVAAKIDAAYALARATPPVGTPGPGGWSTSVGQAAADQILAARRSDGSADTIDYQIRRVPGQWRPTGAGPDPVTPHWGRVRPFGINGTPQFRPGPPGGFTSLEAMLASDAYAAQVIEVKRVGKLTAPKANRDDEQTQIAHFWANDLKGTYKPPGQLLRHTRIVLRQFPNISRGERARLYALVSMALADAAIVAWEAKYDTLIDLWRPESAIQLADTDLTELTVKDPDWLPLSQRRNGTPVSPPFPAYISGHATFAGAWAGAMKSFFGTDNVTFAANTEDPFIANGVTRTFTSFSAAAAENARSRIYLGVHFQWDADAGISSGTAIGTWIGANRLR